MRETYRVLVDGGRACVNVANLGRKPYIPLTDYVGRIMANIVWKMNAESARRVNHPAPFPEELPHRLINLYSFEDDVILDPFMGSGTTAVAALKNKRRFVGYDISEEYIKIANNRIANVGQLL